MNKKWTERLVLALIYWLLVSFAATASYLIADQIIRMMNTVLVLEETHAASVIRVFLTILVSGAILTAVSYWEGYHFASFDKGVVFPAIGIAMGVHFVLGFLFGFSPWVTGGALYMAGWIKYGAGYTSECSMATKDVSVLIFVGAFAIFAALYTLFMSFPQYYGMLKRYADRKALLEENSHRTTYVQPTEEYANSDEDVNNDNANPL